MKLYKIEATYNRNKLNVSNIPFKFFVIAEDEIDASDKVLQAILSTPFEMDDVMLKTEPEEIATNDCGEQSALLIE